MTLRLRSLGLGLIPASSRPAPTTAPVNTRPPGFVGFLTQAQTVAIDPGDWDGLPSPNYAYSVQRSGVEVGTSASYTWQAADVTAGASAMTVISTATNSVGSTPATSAGVTIAAPLAISGTAGAATVGVSYSFTPAVSGGHTPRTYALTGTLPAGLSLNTSTGVVSGTPTASGTASGLDITVTDADGLTASHGAFSIVVGTSATETVDQFALNGGTSPLYPNSIFPTAVYLSTPDITVHLQTDQVNSTTPGTTIPTKQIRCYAFDHTNRTWLTPTNLFVDDSALTGDDVAADNHGGGALFKDADGYLHAFGGNHNGALKHWRTTAPVAALSDLLSWTAQATLGTDITYAHPIMDGDGTTLRLYCRKESLNYSAYCYTATFVAGVATWTGPTPICSFGVNTRVYLSQQLDLGGGEHLLTFVRADATNAVRQDVYALKVTPSTGRKRNLANTFTQTDANFVVAADLDANCRLVDNGSGVDTGYPSACVENGRYHVIWVDGTSVGVHGTGGSFTIHWRCYDLSTGSMLYSHDFSLAVQDVLNYVCIYPTASGVEAIMTATPAAAEYQNASFPSQTYLFGGDAYISTWTPAGGSSGWSAPTLLRAATRRASGGSPSWVLNGKAEFKFTLNEHTTTVDFTVGGDLRTWAYGEAGVLLGYPYVADTDVAAYVARLANAPSTAREKRWSNLVRAIKGANGWASLDGFYIAAGQAALADADKNVVQNAFNLTRSGGTFTLSAAGMTGDGAAKASTGYNLSTGGGHLVQDSASCYVWTTSEGQSGVPEFGTDGAGLSFRIIVRNASDQSQGRTMNTTNITASSTVSGLGYYGMNRIASTTARLGRYRTLPAQSSVASGAVSQTLTFDFNTSGGGSTRTMAIRHFGGGRNHYEQAVTHNIIARFLIEEGVIT